LFSFVEIEAVHSTATELVSQFLAVLKLFTLLPESYLVYFNI